MLHLFRHKLLPWLEKSFLGTDGTPSSRKLTAFWFTVLSTLLIISKLIMVYLLAFGQIKLNQDAMQAVGMLDDTLYFTCGMTLLCLGIITIDSVMKHKAEMKAKKEEAPA